MYLNNLNHIKVFKNWLLFTIFLILLMISVGGITRLTNSGLSITEWELFKGILPPVNEEQWSIYFSMYKEIPQYKILNNNMLISDFKTIFYWEYFHRLLGRFIGLFFMIPLIYFTFKGIIKKEKLLSFYLIFILICFQGFIGWYMVQSGLTKDITVSHFRLALHLGIAFIIISLLFWNYLNILNSQDINFFSSFKKFFSIKFLLLIVFLQIIMGAFVSGLDAGMIYQTWPLMNTSFFPDDTIIKSLGDFLIFENKSLIQFYHRILAYLILIYSLFIGIKLSLDNNYILKKSFFKYFFILIFQVVLGILTLVSGLNIYLAALHQFTGVLLILSILNLNYKIIDEKS